MKTIFITGANRGLGFAIAQRFFETDLALNIILGCRSHQNGEEAVAHFAKDGLKTVSFLELDITSHESITNAVKTVEEKYEKLDILVNNAAIAEAKGSMHESLNTIMFMNVISTAAVMDAFIPLLGKSLDPRIINLSSSVGSCGLHTGQNRYSYNDAIAPYRMYCVSKAALNMLGIQFEKLHPEIIVQTVNPGHCKTGMNDFQGIRDPKEGANVVIILAFSEKGRYLSGNVWETIGSSMEPQQLSW